MINQTASNDDGERATIWQELDDWAREFKPWQRYIVSYLVREGKLSEQRVNDAYALFLFEHELGEAPSPNIEIPATISGRPASAVSAPVHITRICNLRSINALPPESELTFSPGLTVIYGGNGAGKSGFARIFSNACFSRAQHKILPDISKTGPQPTPEADVSIEIGSQGGITLKFDGETEHPDLKRFAVFDAEVARVHLTAPNSFGFKPVGFDVFPEMAKCYGEITRRIDEEVTNRKRENTFSRSFVSSESDVSKLVATLGHNTDLATLRKYAEFGRNEVARLEEVQRQRGEVRAKSIPEAIDQLQQAKKDIGALKSNLERVVSLLDEEIRVSYRGHVSDFIFRNRVVAEQGAESFKTELFKAAGGGEWESFVSFARDLAKLEHADYPQPDDRCLLCHQPLDSSAHDLIHRIWDFLASEARTQAQESEQTFHATINNLEALDLDFFADTTTCRSNVTRMNPLLAQSVSSFVAHMASDYHAIIMVMYDVYSDHRDGVIPTKAWDSAELSRILAALAAQENQIDTDVTRLRDQNPEEALKALDAEHIELRHRQVLSQLLPDIEVFVRDLAWIEAAGGPAKRSLNSRPITTKEADLFTKVVATEYRRQFVVECGDLNCAVPVEWKTEGQRGQTLRSLSVRGGYSPSQILSEGEQRAVALADFLSEVGLNTANAGIILDDPVTSQDHYRKRNMAARLVREANSRQVIILTHDLVFLTMLATEASIQAVEILTHWVERDGSGRPGQISLDDSPATTPQYRDAKKAKATCAEAKGESGSKRLKLIQRGIGELRRTIEEIVPHFLLKQAVNRWSDRIMVTSLRKVNWDAALVEDIIRVFEELSSHIEGHSHTEQSVGAPPEPADLEKWITQVDDIIRRARRDR